MRIVLLDHGGQGGLAGLEHALQERGLRALSIELLAGDAVWFVLRDRHQDDLRALPEVAGVAVPGGSRMVAIW